MDRDQARSYEPMQQRAATTIAAPSFRRHAAALPLGRAAH